ncbi:MAG: PEP-CTERM sorting domain-containing protein, partial [Fimbriimonadaceae bacterium]|nr:PEP-CTERM sorting domain-containing protein [Fimbriimonadaceae bacterium]
KVFITERGIGGANSKFSLQALDSKGNPIGKVVNVDTKNRINTNIQLATYGQGNDPKFIGSQTMSYYSFDVAQFGVNQISSLRITTPNVHLSSGQDIQPDFKVFGSAAPVPEPGTMLALAAGAGLIAARRRRKA